MTVREYVAGQLIRLARTLDPNCVMDFNALRGLQGNGLPGQCVTYIGYIDINRKGNNESR